MASPNPSIPTLAPLVAAAIATAVAVVACDRPATRATAPENFSRNEAPAQPAAEQPTAGASTAGATSTLPSREALTDTVITGKIKTAILNDPGMQGSDVSVNTDRGVVMLTGIAKSQEQIAMASGHAQRQDGVMRVDTHLSLNQ